MPLHVTELPLMYVLEQFVVLLYSYHKQLLTFTYTTAQGFAESAMILFFHKLLSWVCKQHSFSCKFIR
jgi:hypothetical protein